MRVEPPESSEERRQIEIALRDHVRGFLDAWLEPGPHSTGERIIRLELSGSYPDTVLHVEVSGIPGYGNHPPQDISVWNDPILDGLPDSDALLIAVWAMGG